MTELKLAKELLGGAFEEHEVMTLEHFADHIKEGRPMTERGADFMAGQFTVRIDISMLCEMLLMPCDAHIRYIENRGKMAERK